MDTKKIQEAVKMIIDAVGEDGSREGLQETPERIAKMYQEIFAGLNQTAEVHLSKSFEIVDNNMVVEKDIFFHSMCEHHFLPFFGTIGIAYVPNKKIFGFGDILKLIEILSRRPQLQERLTEEIARYIYELLDCQGVYVVIEAKHLCMTMRGQKKENTKILTTSAKGIFETDLNKKMEVLTLLK